MRWRELGCHLQSHLCVLICPDTTWQLLRRRIGTRGGAVTVADEARRILTETRTPARLAERSARAAMPSKTAEHDELVPAKPSRAVMYALVSLQGLPNWVIRNGSAFDTSGARSSNACHGSVLRHR
jgi:hypothetical protein